MTSMDNQQNIPPMPRPDFAGMTDKALAAYLAKNAAYVSSDDSRGTRAELLTTAGLVADRKAEDFVAARAEADRLNQVLKATHEVLQQFPKGAMGLTPDDVKRTPEWQAAFREHNRAFQAIRKFNGSYTKTFADELRHERQIRRAAGLAPC